LRTFEALKIWLFYYMKFCIKNRNILLLYYYYYFLYKIIGEEVVGGWQQG